MIIIPEIPEPVYHSVKNTVKSCLYGVWILFKQILIEMSSVSFHADNRPAMVDAKIHK